MVCTIQYGQAFVERGLSITSDTLQPNMVERTVVAQRTVYDGVCAMLSGDDPKAVHKIVVSKEMIRHCNAARMRYRNFLDEQKTLLNVSETTEDGKKSSNNGFEQARKKDELAKEKVKLADSEKLITKLTKEADELALKAETKNQIKLLAESNLKRKRVDELKINFNATKSKIQKMEREINV